MPAPENAGHCIELIQKRPELYAGELTHPTGLLRETLCIPLDNLLTENATKVSVIVHKDGSVSVADNGPGLPREIQPCGRTITEIIFTQRSAGCRFHKKDPDNEKFCNDGIVTTTALSKWLIVDNQVDGACWQTKFEHGVLAGPEVPVGEASETGLKIHFLPDSSYFEQPQIAINEFVDWFAELNLTTPPGASVTLHAPDAKPVRLM